MIHKHNKNVIIMVLVVILFTNIFLMYKNLNNMEVKLDDVRLKEIEKDNNSLAIMLEDIEGNYKESDIEEFPSNLAYSFNLELSGCIDSNGLIIEDALTYDNVLNNITIKTNKTTYCYIYFDRDKEKPQEFTFYIGGTSNPEYLTNVNTSIYLSWSDNDIKEYCISESNASDNCRWNEVSGTSITSNYTLSSGNGTKTLYAYLKDYAGNKSPVVSDSIILDTNTYTITYNLNGGTQGSGAITSYKIDTNTFNLPTPSRDGYIFEGWYTASDFSGSAVTQVTKGSTGNKIFYAKWELASKDILNLAEGIDLTGGMVNFTGTLSKLSNGYRVTDDVEKVEGLGNYSMYTANMIDLTDITTLTCTLSNNFNLASSRDNGIFITKTKPWWTTDPWGSYVTRYVFWTHNQHASAGTYTATIDVSSLTGSYYIFFRGILTPTTDVVDYFTFHSITAK